MLAVLALVWATASARQCESASRGYAAPLGCLPYPDSASESSGTLVLLAPATDPQ